MSAPFEVNFTAGWADMDYNKHMRNTAFLDRCVDSRMLFFSQHGFPVAEFERLGFGPVVMRDEISYFAEIRLLESFTVRLQLAGISGDGSRFSLRNEFHSVDGKKAALVTSTGGWLDLKARKLMIPPTELLSALRALVRTDDFQEMKSSLTKS